MMQSHSARTRTKESARNERGTRAAYAEFEMNSFGYSSFTFADSRHFAERIFRRHAHWERTFDTVVQRS